jgi:hypothetical protein
MKALVAQELSGPSGLAYTDVDEVGGEDVAVIGVGWGEFVNRNPVAQSLFGCGVARLVEALESLANGGVMGKLVLQP